MKFESETSRMSTVSDEGAMMRNSGTPEETPTPESVDYEAHESSHDSSGGGDVDETENELDLPDDYVNLQLHRIWVGWDSRSDKQWMSLDKRSGTLKSHFYIHSRTSKIDEVAAWIPQIASEPSKPKRLAKAKALWRHNIGKRLAALESESLSPSQEPPPKKGKRAVSKALSDPLVASGTNSVAKGHSEKKVCLEVKRSERQDFENLSFALYEHPILGQKRLSTIAKKLASDLSLETTITIDTLREWRRKAALLGLTHPREMYKMAIWLSFLVDADEWPEGESVSRHDWVRTTIDMTEAKDWEGLNRFVVANLAAVAISINTNPPDSCHARQRCSELLGGLRTLFGITDPRIAPTKAVATLHSSFSATRPSKQWRWKRRDDSADDDGIIVPTRRLIWLNIEGLKRKCNELRSTIEDAKAELRTVKDAMDRWIVNGIARLARLLDFSTHVFDCLPLPVSTEVAFDCLHRHNISEARRILQYTTMWHLIEPMNYMAPNVSQAYYKLWREFDQADADAMEPDMPVTLENILELNLELETRAVGLAELLWKASQILRPINERLRDELKKLDEQAALLPSSEVTWWRGMDKTEREEEIQRRFDVVMDKEGKGLKSKFLEKGALEEWNGRTRALIGMHSREEAARIYAHLQEAINTIRGQVWVGWDEG